MTTNNDYSRTWRKCINCRVSVCVRAYARADAGTVYEYSTTTTAIPAVSLERDSFDDDDDQMHVIDEQEDGWGKFFVIYKLKATCY
jgi:hypothetical protein